MNRDRIDCTIIEVQWTKARWDLSYMKIKADNDRFHVLFFLLLLCFLLVGAGVVENV